MTWPRPATFLTRGLSALSACLSPVPAGQEVAVANRRSRDRWGAIPAVSNRFKMEIPRPAQHVLACGLEAA
jgi:hypothetical protein